MALLIAPTSHLLLPGGGWLALSPPASLLVAPTSHLLLPGGGVLLLPEADPLIETTAEEYLKVEAELVAVAEKYLKASASLSYPENYLKFGAALITLPVTVEIYAKFRAALLAEGGNYLKLGPRLEQRCEPYVKFACAFPPPTERYIKTAAAFAGAQNDYIRFAARFASHGDYLKVRATLVRSPILTDLPDDAAPGDVGLLSRQYLSLGSVKKEI